MLLTSHSFAKSTENKQSHYLFQNRYEKEKNLSPSQHMEKIFREIQFCQTRLVSERKAKVVNIEISVKIEPFLKLHVSKSGGH